MSTMKISRWSRGVAALLFLATIPPSLAVGGAEGEAKPSAPGEAISYYKQVRPIFQANCQGCHQPAKAGGGYVMTSFDRLVAGGDSKAAAVVPKAVDESHLIEMITPEGEEAEMPMDKPPLSKAEIDLIRNWVAQGALDDTPEGVRRRYDKDHPPVYSRPPVISAMDYSPDGQTLALGGFHEVLLCKADGSGLVARLIGLSERIESVRFSPKGDRLAVTGGLPGRMGEVQVWDVAKRKLLLSVPVTSDTVYGASWSPDGTKIAFGCADNSVRAVEAETGAQVLFMGSHNNWALDTAFSADGSHLVSVGRDMAAKLTEVATQRFVDNITSITPGALKGGIAAVARHPKRDEFVLGGSDGKPKLYRAFRQTVRVIGDDSNLIREFPEMTGRVYSVAVSPDGKRIAAGSSLDGAGQVSVYSYEFDTSLPDNIKAIMAKVASTRSAEEKATLEKYHSDGATLIAKTVVEKAGVYAVAFQPDGKLVAATGGDGTVRLIDPASGSVVKEFSPAPLADSAPADVASATAVTPKREEPVEAETLPAGETLAAGGPAGLGPVEHPVRLRAVDRHRPARLGGCGRRDPHGRGAALRRRRRGLAVRPRPAQGRRRGGARAGARRQDRGRSGHRLGGEVAGPRRFRARRRPRALEARLQFRDVSRLGAGAERVQAEPPRLRPDLRRPGAGRRPCLATREPRLARR
ncbi:MAG: c-type cytochrome domain-containing protein [Singulisphaera sp.]